MDDAIIDASGRTVVYMTRLSPGDAGHLAAIDVATGVETMLVTGFNAQQPSLTSDTRTVLYTDSDAAGTQLYTVAIDGSGRRRITNVNGGVFTAIVSGDGRVAYAAGPSGFMRVDMDSGAVTTLAPARRKSTAFIALIRPPMWRLWARFSSWPV